ncbi:hypothetical protein BJY21_000240 [Kineosphaera limosa]|uniref:hypothetical protein n=1 Tax=Kineosphaera limosa TaxID=111564 RepID=UPI0002E2232A|nr:hypothetical protein [Kineosphaera limosa]NYD99055.1 hypothetical protein [Kineosphaera limosa]
MTGSSGWRAARLAGLALVGVSMALAPGLAGQSLARTGHSSQRPRVERPGHLGSRLDITQSRVDRAGAA